MVGHKESMAEMEESMKKKNLIVAIVMASMIMGGCGQKTVTSVSEDPRFEQAQTMYPSDTNGIQTFHR